MDPRKLGYDVCLRPKDPPYRLWGREKEVRGQSVGGRSLYRLVFSYRISNVEMPILGVT